MFNKTLTITLILLCQFVLVSNGQKIQQLTPKKLQDSISQNQFTFVYFYSASCQYCIKFTPMFEQLAKINNISGLNFGKIDATVYKDLSEKYDIFSYPTLALFWKGIDFPIFYRKERQTAEILQFLRSKTKLLQNFVTKQHLQKLSKSQREMGIIYIGPTHTLQQNITTILSYLQPYHPFAILHSNVTEPYLQVKDKMLTNFNIKQLRNEIRSSFAKVFDIEEEAWVRIHQSKEIGIALVDVSGGSKNREVYGVLGKLAREMPEITFMRLQPSQQQYKQAIDFLEIQSEDTLIAIHKKYDAKFTCPKPYNQPTIRQFIKQVLNLSATLYMRSQKTTHKQKLTLSNFDSKINEAKDIVVFLYRTDDRLQAKFMDLFKFLSKKLENNSNISLLRCNLSKNQIQMKLGFQVKITPSIIFYQNRVKDKPVHFLNSKISAESVIQFIMENTTFDWEDQWGEL